MGSKFICISIKLDISSLRIENQFAFMTFVSSVPLLSLSDYIQPFIASNRLCLHCILSVIAVGRIPTSEVGNASSFST